MRFDRAERAVREVLLNAAKATERKARVVAVRQRLGLDALDQGRARAELSERLQRAQCDVRQPEIWFPGFDQ